MLSNIMQIFILNLTDSTNNFMSIIQQFKIILSMFILFIYKIVKWLHLLKFTYFSNFKTLRNHVFIEFFIVIDGTFNYLL